MKSKKREGFFSCWLEKRPPHTEGGDRRKHKAIQKQDLGLLLSRMSCKEKLVQSRKEQTIIMLAVNTQAENGCRYKTGFYGGKFMPLHKGHIDCILRCASECEKLYVVMMYYGDQENEIISDYTGNFPLELLSPQIRERALRAELSPFDNIEVISYDCRDADRRAQQEGKHPWYYECEDMVSLMGRFDAIYASEPEYIRTFRQFYPWADAVLLDGERSRVPISSTQLREMTFAEAYPHLSREYQKHINRKVLFVGSESCGKTTLVRKLACAFGTSFTEEMGRLACEKYKVSSPGYDMYPSFVYQQKVAEQKAVEDAYMVAICDTDAIITEFYANLYEGKELPIAAEAAENESWDKVFLVRPTVPWVDDGLRTSPDEGERIFQSSQLEERYRSLGYDLVILDGNYRENYEKARLEIEMLLGARGGEQR